MRNTENRINAVFRIVCLMIVLVMTRVYAAADTLPAEGPGEGPGKVPVRIVLRPEKEEGEPDPDLSGMIRAQITEQVGDEDPELADRLCACVSWAYDYSGGVIPPGENRPAGESEIVFSFAEDPEYVLIGWTLPEEISPKESVVEEPDAEEMPADEDMWYAEETYEEEWDTEEMSDEEVWDPEMLSAEEDRDMAEISAAEDQGVEEVFFEEIRDPELRSFLTTRPGEETAEEEPSEEEPPGEEEPPEEETAGETEEEEYIDAEEIAEENAEAEGSADEYVQEEVFEPETGPVRQTAAGGSYRQYQTVMTQPDAVPQEISESVEELIRGEEQEKEGEEAKTGKTQVRLLRTDSTGKETDLTDMFRDALSQADPDRIDWNTLLAPLPENDGTYVLRTMEEGNGGESNVRETSFSVNRFGSVYTYNDAVQSLRGKTVKAVSRPLVVSEYNPDHLEKNSWKVTVTRDGQPLDPVLYTVSRAGSGQGRKNEWSRCDYVVSSENFREDGVYRLAVTSRDAAGNTPEMNRYNGGEITFTVDGSPPELQAVQGLEEAVVDGRKAEVAVTAFDTVGLARLSAFVDGKCMAAEDTFQDRHRAELAFSIEPGEDQHVRIVAEDTAGNVLDTDEKTVGKRYRFQPAFPFSRKITVRLPEPAAPGSGKWRILILMAGGCTAVSAVMLRRIFGPEKRRTAAADRETDPD